MQYSAYDGAQHRIERLKKAVRIATAMCGLSEDQAKLLITRVHDHKGQLILSWTCMPTEQQRLAFGVAWEQCSEPAANVSHVLDDGKDFDTSAIKF